MSQKINIAPVISQTKAWMMVLAGALFYCYQFMLRVSPNMMTDELMLAFNISATELSLFTSCYYIGYSLALIPLGVAIDHYGPKQLMSLGGVLCALSCFIFSSTSNQSIAGFSRILMGMGGSCGFLGALKIGTLWLPAKSFGKVIGVTMVFGTVGAILGGTPLEWLLNTVGWRTTMNMIGSFGLVLSVILIIGLKNVPNPKSLEQKPVFAGLKIVLADKQTWYASLFGMFMYIPLIILGDLWGVSFLEQAYKIKESEAATIVAALFIGISIGSPGFAFLSDRFQKRKPLMIIGSLACLICYILIVACQSIPLNLMYLLFFLAGLFFGGKSLGFASIVENLPSQISGVALAFANMLIMLSGSFALPLTGFLLDLHKENSLGNQLLKTYSVNDFKFAFILLPLCVSLAVLFSILIRETYPKS